MRTKIILAAVAVAAIALLAAACGGGGDGNGGAEAGIRTQRGLSLASLVAGARAAAEDDASGGAAPGVPESRTGVVPGLGGDLVGGLFPAQQQSLNGITVPGFGSATADADRAIVEFYFGTAIPGVEPVPEPRGDQSEPGGSGGSGDTPSSPPVEFTGQVEPITEADLQAVIDAIVAQGVSRDDIEFIGSPYYDKSFSSATLRVTVRDLDALDGVVTAATEAAGGLVEISLQNTSVSYTVSDCTALERAAMQAGVEDARERGEALAQVLGVSLGSVLGASTYAYSPFGGTPCDAGVVGPVPLGGVAYAAGQSSQVQVVASVTITYAIGQ